MSYQWNKQTGIKAAKISHDTLHWSNQQIKRIFQVSHGHLKLHVCVSADPKRRRVLWENEGRRGSDTRRGTRLPNLNNARRSPACWNKTIVWIAQLPVRRQVRTGKREQTTRRKTKKWRDGARRSQNTNKCKRRRGFLFTDFFCGFCPLRFTKCDTLTSMQISKRTPTWKSPTNSIIYFSSDVCASVAMSLLCTYLTNRTLTDIHVWFQRSR